MMEMIGTEIQGPLNPDLVQMGSDVVQESMTRHILADMLENEYDKNHELFDLEHIKIEALILQKNTMEIISLGIPGPSGPTNLY